MPPALLNHCKAIYDEMLKDATLRPVDGVDTLVWEGHTTHLFKNEGLATPYYTTVTQKLQAMGCVSQLHRGGGPGMSQWALLAEPTEELFENSGDRIAGKMTPRDIQQQSFRNLTHSLNRLGEAIELLGQRVTAIEESVAHLLKMLEDNDA